MIKNNTRIQIPYSDTDQMGIVHHSNFLKYCETARWELFRAIGVTYRSVEEQGYFMPVTQVRCKYIKPIRYDDTITISTTMKEIKGARAFFSYIAYNENGEIVFKADTDLAFVKKEDLKPCIIPDFIQFKLQNYQYQSINEEFS